MVDEALVHKMLAKMDGVEQLVQAKAELLSEKIGFTDRNAQQLVRLVEEKLIRVDEKVTGLETNLKEHQAEMHKRMDELDQRVDSLELSRAKLIGITLGSGGFSGAIVAGVLKLVGGQ